MFKEETEKAPEHFMTRRFDDLEFVAILIDGKTLREEQILLAVGLTTQGEKNHPGVRRGQNRVPFLCRCAAAGFTGTRLPGGDDLAGVT